MNRYLKYFIVCASTILLAVLMLGSVLGRSNAAEDAYRHFAVYTEVISRIKSDYVEEPEMKNVTLGALNGMLEAIDPFASYLNADQYKQYLKSKEQKKAGVGLILSRRYGYVGVVDSIPGSPADKAGLTTGDVLETIGGVATRDMPLAYAEMLLRGDAGTTVELAVLRVRRGAEAQKISLIRAPAQYPPVVAKVLPEQIGRLEVPTLEGDRAKEVPGRIAELQKQGVTRLILDLRHSASGTPEAGIALANLFMDKGLITYVQGQKVSRQDFEADSTKTVCRLPLVVLTNRGTAGGAEIAASALLDSKRAEVVGERTYGDAAVRRALTMEDGSAVILSVAKYYTPSGKAIQDTGVTPSVAVAEPEPPASLEEEEQTPPVKPRSSEEDVQLQKAIEVLTKGAAHLVKNQNRH